MKILFSQQPQPFSTDSKPTDTAVLRSLSQETDRLTLQPFKQPIRSRMPYFPPLKKIYDALERIWSNRWISHFGPLHHELEENPVFAETEPCLSAEDHGDSGLRLALQAIQIHPGDEVITSPLTEPPIRNAITGAGAIPIYCDIDPKTLNIDPAKIETLIRPGRTKAIMVEHFLGIPNKVETIQKIADKYGLKVIYNAANALGVEINGKGIGTYGNYAVFSTHATKQFFHTVEGGIFVYNGDDEAHCQTLRNMSNYGFHNKQLTTSGGFDGKMSELHAAIGLSMMDHIDVLRDKRQSLDEMYRNGLKGIPGLTTINPTPGVQSNYSHFLIQINEQLFGHSRNDVVRFLKAHNVETRYYASLPSDYDWKTHRNPSAEPTKLPWAHQAASTLIDLPIHNSLTEQDVNLICRMLRHFQQTKD